jgi:hypothetical protein
VSEADWDPLTSIAACTGLVKIHLFLQLYKLSSNIQRSSTLLSTISSPHLEQITLVLGDDPFTFIDKARPIRDPLSFEEWQALEDTLLGVSLRSGGALEVAIVFSVLGGARSAPGCETFFPRFREVGAVRFEFPRVES